MNRHLELMKLHDGEASEEEARALEEALSADDRAVLGGLEQVGDFVRAHSAAGASPADSIADSVMAALEREPGSPEATPRKVEPKLEVVKGGGSRGRAAAWGAGVALALAAAGVLWLRSAEEPAPRAPVAQAPQPSLPEPVVEAPSVAPAIEEENEPAAAIESVDFGNQAGTIFMVPAGEETTPVVWLVDEPAGARMEPL